VRRLGLAVYVRAHGNLQQTQIAFDARAPIVDAGGSGSVEYSSSEVERRFDKGINEVK
jgi:hypothetical protein